MSGLISTIAYIILLMPYQYFVTLILVSLSKASRRSLQLATRTFFSLCFSLVMPNLLRTLSRYYSQSRQIVWFFLSYMTHTPRILEISPRGLALNLCDRVKQNQSSLAQSLAIAAISSIQTRRYILRSLQINRHRSARLYINPY